MIGLPKLVLLLLLALAAWYGYRWLNGLGRPAAMPRRRAASPPPGPAIQAEDLVACGVCGAYVAAHAPGCGRRDCPNPR